MTITTKTVEPGIVSVTVDYPPVNAIPSKGWFELGDAITAVGRGRAVTGARCDAARTLH